MHPWQGSRGAAQNLIKYASAVHFAEIRVGFAWAAGNCGGCCTLWRRRQARAMFSLVAPPPQYPGRSAADRTGRHNRASRTCVGSGLVYRHPRNAAQRATKTSENRLLLINSHHRAGAGAGRGRQIMRLSSASGKRGKNICLPRLSAAEHSFADRRRRLRVL